MKKKQLRMLAVAIAIVIVIGVVVVISSTYSDSQSSKKEEEEYIDEITEILYVVIETRGEFMYLLEEDPEFILFMDGDISATYRDITDFQLERFSGLNPPSEEYSDLHRYVGEYLTLNSQGFDEWARAVTEGDTSLFETALSYLRQADERRDLIKAELEKFQK